MIADIVLRWSVGVGGVFGQDCTRIRSVAECAGTGERIGKCIARGLNFEPLFLGRSNRDIKVARVGGYPFYRSTLSPEFAADDANVRSVIVGDLGNRAGRNILIARVGHL